MKRSLIIILFLTPAFCWSQQGDLLRELLQSSPNKSNGEAIAKTEAFIKALEQKKEKLKSDELFIRHLFRQTHKQFLHHYQEYSDFQELFGSGKYDCLSATSLLSVILDHFKYDYKIIETNYHIFTVVNSSQGRILIESTDKLEGIVTNETEINARLNRYHDNNQLANNTTDKYYYQYHLQLFHELRPQQLVGLLYYNQAVKAFNSSELIACSVILKKAIRIYNSPRIEEMALLLINATAESDLSEDVKADVIRPFVPLVKSRLALVASR